MRFVFHFNTFFLLLFFVCNVNAQNRGISFQGVIKDPSNNWVNVTGVTIRARILAPNGCVLRDESYPTQNIVNGYINLNLGNGTPGGVDPGYSFKNIFSNSLGALTGLTCINTDGTLNGSISSYTANASDARKLHISLTVGADNLNAQFNIRSSAFALNSEMLNGYADTSFIKTSTNITQSNAEAWFASAAFSQILAGTYNAATATSATSATNVTGTVAIANGGTGATSASGARTNLGLGTLAVMSPTGTADATTYLRGDGTWAAIAAGGGTITGVTAGTGITGGGTTGTVTVSLATAGTAGTYTKVTTDAYGRVTSGTTLSASDIPNLAWSKITSGTPTTLSGYGITDGVQNAGSGATSNVTSLQAGTDASKPTASTAGRVYLATDTQKIYRDNGTTWDAITSSGGSGTITGVTAGTGLTGGGSSGSVTVGFANIANNSILANTSGSAGAPVATTLSTLLDTVGSTQGSVLYRGSSGWSVLAPGTSGQYLQTQGAAANPQWATVSASGFSGSLVGDVSGTQGATSVDKIKGKTVSPAAYSSGQVLRYDGTDWVNTTLSSADLSNDSNLLKASNMPANCSASQALTFSSPTGTWVCSNIAGLDAGVITTGTIANARLPASATYWDAATGGINYAGGRVGIGTTAPGYPLDVQSATADMRIKSTTFGNRTRLRINNGTNDALFGLEDSTGGTYFTGSLPYAAVIGNQNSAAMQIGVGGNIVATAVSGGNFGIGVTAPTGRLDISSGIDNSASGIGVVDSGTLRFTNGNTSSVGTKSKINLNIGSLGAGVISSYYAAYNAAGDIGVGLQFGTQYNNAGGVVERMRIDQNGNVGIGTSSPKSPLHLQSTVTGAVPATSGTTPSTGLFTRLSSAGGATLDHEMLSGGSQWLQATNITDQSQNYDIALNPNGGNIGIGTTTPQAKFHISSSVGGTYQAISRPAGDFGAIAFKTGLTSNRFHMGVSNEPEFGSDGGSNFGIWRFNDAGVNQGAAFYIRRDTGNVGIGTTSPASLLHVGGNNKVTVGNLIASTATAVTVSNTTTNSEFIAGQSDSNRLSMGWVYNATPANAYASIGVVGGNNLILQGSAGNVGIGTTAPDDKFVVYNGSTTGRYTTGGWTHSSDARLKHDIEPLENSLEKVLKLQGVQYKFNSDPSNSEQIGFIAQQVEPIFPEVVQTDKNGYKSMIYSNLVAPVVESIKALYLRITTVERNIATFSDNKADKSELLELREQNKKLEKENLEIKKYLCLKDPSISFCKE